MLQGCRRSGPDLPKYTGRQLFIDDVILTNKMRCSSLLKFYRTHSVAEYCVNFIQGRLSCMTFLRVELRLNYSYLNIYCLNLSLRSSFFSILALIFQTNINCWDKHVNFFGTLSCILSTLVYFVHLCSHCRSFCCS